MSQASRQTNPTPDLQFTAIARALRFGLAAVVVGLSYPNIRCAFKIHRFEAIFREMLDKPLPPATEFIIHSQSFFIGLSIAIPLAAIAAIFVSRLDHSIYIMGILILVVFTQLFFQWHTLMDPLSTIVTSLGQDAAP